ncbi:choice-of-anchor L domain-containing protein, partial [Aquimarina longa]|uniref:choice-of-anchor L domain-containing protein n=1 Tax=Aquimarina longa TaxID=1080221 RepID=UPI000783FC4D
MITPTLLKSYRNKLLFFVIYLFYHGISYSQATVTNNSADANDLRNQILGIGVSVSNQQILYGANDQFGTFENGVTGANLQLESGIILTTGNVTTAFTSNNETNTTINQVDEGPDPDLNLIDSTADFDTAAYQFEFTTDGDGVVIEYQFASDEYPEYVCSRFNDAFGFFVSGGDLPATQNIALLPNNAVVSVNTINNGTSGSNADGTSCDFSQSTLHIDNNDGSAGSVFIEYDGISVKLFATLPLTSGVTYTMKMAMADVGDSQWDSGVFIKVFRAAYDTDGDGKFDAVNDIDDDNDGILDTVESGGVDPDTDNDGDNVPLYLDNNDNDNSIGDTDNAVEAAFDADGDGIANHLDSDSDGDNCPDANEAYNLETADTDGNGYYGTGNPPSTTADGRVIGAPYTSPEDTDSNSTVDFLEVGPNTDNDANLNGCDPDDDNDGNPDVTDPNDVTPTALNDSIDIVEGTTGTINILTNDDFIPSANTTITNLNSGTATGTVSFNGTTGVMEYTPAPGEEGNIVAINYQVCNAGVTPIVCDDATVNITVQVDTDNDGDPDVTDPDDDNDGVIDTGDNAPLNPNSCRDTDGDGCDDCTNSGANNSGGDPANDGTDSDGDGICDISDAVPILTINDITTDNVVNTVEASANVNVTGVVTGDFNNGDIVTLTINGTSYTGPVNSSGIFNISVSGSDLENDPDLTVEGSVTTTNGGGFSSTDTDTQIYSLDTSAPSAPTVVITEDTNNDGVISASELSGNVDVTVTLPADAVAGDIVTITDGNGNTQNVTLTATDITNGNIAVNFPNPGDNGTITATAFVTDQAGNQGTSANDTATINTSAPSAPTVVITEDTNNDGVISASEATGPVDVTVTLPADAVAGDTVTITDGNGNTQNVTLTATDITNGNIAVNFPNPGDNGTITATAFVTDQAGNQGTSANDTATINTSAPSAPTVVITEDTNNDGVISTSEATGPVDVTVTLPADAIAGDTVTITDGNGNTQNVTLTATDITNGNIAVNFPNPGDNGTITATAFVTDQAGNQGTSANDTATINTSAPSAPTVVITEDTNNDGVISASEATGPVDVAVTLPADAVAGDIVTITDGNGNTQNVTLTATDITNGNIAVNFPNPGDNGTITATAFVTDQAGNQGTSANDTATINTSAPSAPTVVITEDTNNDGVISTSEATGPVDVTVTLPADA